MDPNANLKEQRAIVARLNTIMDEESNDGVLNGAGQCAWIEESMRLVELVEALDGWLSSHGFLPAAWIPRSGSRHG
jgi:hypothetical protein